jgi:hypothetical protein
MWQIFLNFIAPRNLHNSWRFYPDEYSSTIPFHPLSIVKKAKCVESTFNFMQIVSVRKNQNSYGMALRIFAHRKRLRNDCMQHACNSFWGNSSNPIRSFKERKREFLYAWPTHFHIYNPDPDIIMMTPRATIKVFFWKIQKEKTIRGWLLRHKTNEVNTNKKVFLR